MQHETFNSIVAIIGLALAAITAWHEFGPESDLISLVDEGRIEVGTPFEVIRVGTIDPVTGEKQPVFGPMIWKIRIHNPSDRPVSLVSFDVFLRGPGNGMIKYSTMRERLSPYDPALPTQPLPENIPANESRAYLVSLFVPFRADKDVENACELGANDLSDLEKCFYKTGRDLFGNQVEVTEHGGEHWSVRWRESNVGPRFVVVIGTADGSTFSSQLPFFPWR